MLTYRDYVFAVFQDYSAAQMALVKIPEQIEVERARRESLRAQNINGDKVTSGDTETDDAWLTSIQKEEYLKKRLEYSKRLIVSVDSLLIELEDDEQELVQRLIIERGRNSAAKLAEAWNVDERTIYRAKDRVLRKLARMMTGEARA